MPQIIRIEDLSLPGLAPYVSLTQAQLRSRQRPVRQGDQSGRSQ